MGGHAISAAAYNRTLEEFKWRKSYTCYAFSTAYNRTLEEFKFEEVL